MTKHESINPALHAFGQAVKAERQARSWSLSALAAEALGNADRKGYVSEVEKGKRRLSEGTILNFKRALDLPDHVTGPLMGHPLPTDDQVEAEDQAASALLTELEALRTEMKLSEALAVALAYDYAEGNPTDLQTALRELRRAFEVAANERDRGLLPANTDDAVNAVLSRVDELNEQGERKAAAELIADEESRAQAGLIRLYDKGIAQAILTRDVEAACAYELKKLPIEKPEPQAQFEALRDVWLLWYERGRDKGLNFDLEVSVVLAREIDLRSKGPDQRGAALNDLGSALGVLGERESGIDRLEKAVTAFREALKEYTRDRVPLEWAMTQSNLGNALRILGDRESSTDRLEEAVTACREALKERTRDRTPLEWAITQNNLGNALQTLGSRESGTDRLEESVTAYREALTERTRDRVPLDWAMTQNNLGTALQTLGERESGTDRLKEAVTAFREALKEYTRDRVPLDWAMTQNNLGIALSALGTRESGIDRLEEAVSAYREALKERTRDRVPLDWAGTTYTSAFAEALIAERTNDLEKAKSALPAAEEARQVLRDGGHEVWAANARTVITEIEAIIARLSEDTAKP